MDNRYRSILVIEDNDGDFVLIEDYLIEAFKTIQINRHHTFGDYIKNQKSDIKHDLILLDLHLPDSSGSELIHKILESNPPVPVIILTGYADLSLAKDSLKLGIDDFLIKDETTPGMLHKSIEFALSRSLYIKQIQTQNEKLKNIAWTQSHVVRAPLSRIMGIVNFIESDEQQPDDLSFWLEQLKNSANEMDAIVQKITSEAQAIQLKKDE
jgi:response regulator of citrate/malate metabolism